MILEEEGALLAAPKEAVAVAFICNLRGSVYRLSADTMFPAKLAKEARKLAGGAVYYAGTWLGNGRHPIGNNQNGRSASKQITCHTG
jgi:hypothetical protein